jgi:hypothetical protein
MYASGAIVLDPGAEAYRNAMDVPVALRKLAENAGAQLCPGTVDAFVGMVDGGAYPGKPTRPEASNPTVAGSIPGGDWPCPAMSPTVRVCRARTKRSGGTNRLLGPFVLLAGTPRLRAASPRFDPA